LISDLIITVFGTLTISWIQNEVIAVIHIAGADCCPTQITVSSAPSWLIILSNYICRWWVHSMANLFNLRYYLILLLLILGHIRVIAATTTRGMP